MCLQRHSRFIKQLKIIACVCHCIQDLLSIQNEQLKKLVNKQLKKKPHRIQDLLNYLHRKIIYVHTKILKNTKKIIKNFYITCCIFFFF